MAYTYSDAQTTSREWQNDIFDWTYGRSSHGWNPSTQVDKHRLVAAGVMDGLLPWGLALSAKFTWASGMPRRITNCAGGFDTANGKTGCIYVKGDETAFKQLDVGLSKAFTFGGNAIALRADVLNIFNTTNYGSFDDWGGGPVAVGAPANKYGGDNLNVGKPNDIRGNPRTLRVALSYKF